MPPTPPPAHTRPYPPTPPRSPSSPPSAQDYIAPEKAKAIQRLAEELCLELRGVAVPLVDAFGIPDHVLRAPIGLASGAHDPYAAYLEAVGFETPLA